MLEIHPENFTPLPTTLITRKVAAKSSPENFTPLPAPTPLSAKTKKQPHEVEDSRRRAKAAFNTVEFLQAFGLPIDITEADREQARAIFLDTPYSSPVPTTPGAAIVLNDLLTRYDYEQVNSTNKMRNYVLFQLFDAAEKATTARDKLKAIELLGKVAEIGLFSTKVEVSVEQKSTSDLESDLHALLRGYDLNALEGELTSVKSQLSLESEMRGIEDEELSGSETRDE